MSGPATQPPVLATVRVRMYQVGFGDCFLLRFEYAGQAKPARHILIDFGTRQLAAGLDLGHIAGEIDARTGGGPDVVVLSHRHQDHMSGFGGSGTDAVVGRWKPRLVVRSWTEDPAASADATGPAGPSGPGGTGLRAGLDQGRAFANALSQAIASSARGLRADVRELALAQLANQAAIDRLDAWSRTGQGVYVSYGQPLALDAVVPGVQVHVIGPPTVAQHPAVAKERATSPEYWQLYQGLAAIGAFDPAAAGAPIATDKRLVGPARWLVERLQAPQLRSLLRIVTALDHAMNNTSVILLIQAGDRRLLFCGDAQIENWEYALTFAPDRQAVLELLRGVDLYKVGHHGSRNATPRTLFNLWTEAATRDRAMVGLMSTKKGVFPGSPGSNTEVPRETLVTALGGRMKPCSRPWICSQGYRMSKSPRPPLATRRLPSSATNKRWCISGRVRPSVFDRSPCEEAAVTIETPIQGGDASAHRTLGFPRGSKVDVRQVDDQDWEVLRALVYHATREDFEVPVGEHTDFASVPRVFVWFIPRYGRYTKAAILHDYLCSVCVPAGRVSRIEADGIFRQAMRELGVPFLRRWIMWAAVRLGALTNPAGREKWWTEAWRVALIAVVALPVVTPAAAVIAISFLVFNVIDFVVWIPLAAVHRIQERRNRPAKKVNRPTLRWKL